MSNITKWCFGDVEVIGETTGDELGGKEGEGERGKKCEGEKVLNLMVVKKKKR